MKKLLSIVICGSILLTSCAVSSPSQQSSLNTSSSSDSSQIVTEQTTTESGQTVSVETVKMLDYSSTYADPDAAESFVSVDDDLLTYVEDVAYHDLVKDLDSTDYYVEGVQAVYVSQEYIEELTYNSQENIYFGYHISDIKEAFGDTPWFFTVDENGQTVVAEYTYKEFEFEFSNMLKDLAIGTGVILVCATVSLVTTTALPAVSMIMMVSAKTATSFALSGGALGAVSSGLVTYFQTGNINQSLQAAMDGGAQGFKIGAITGAVTGAGKELFFLKKATAGGLTMKQAAIIQKEAILPAEMISEISSMEEYNVLKEAHMQTALVNQRTALLPQDIDWDSANPYDPQGRTNRELVKQGLAPYDSRGVKYDLHHIGQEKDGILAMLPTDKHHTIPTSNQKSVPHGNEWNKQRRDFYKALYKMIENFY